MAGLRTGASRQNQDLRDYRIFRILTALVCIWLGGIFGWGETRKTGDLILAKAEGQAGLSGSAGVPPAKPR